MKIRRYKSKSIPEPQLLSAERNFLLSHLITSFGPLQDSTVLELGYEDDALLTLLHNNGAVMCTGIQHNSYNTISPATNPRGTGINLYSGDITLNFFLNHRFNFIVLDRQLSGHYSTAALQEIARNARKNIARNGKVVICEPASRALINNKFVKVTGGVTKTGQHPLKRSDIKVGYHWDVNKVVEIFTNAGFSLVYEGIDYPKPTKEQVKKFSELTPWTQRPMAYIVTFKVI